MLEGLRETIEESIPYKVQREGKISAVKKEYYRQYKLRRWLFEVAKPGRNISVRTVQAIFKHACKKEGISKDVGVYSLRHSFTTHLLESEVDLRYIQEILGRVCSKTTEIYTHVSKKNLGKIISPNGYLRS